ncbi:MAG: diaminopimelate decarboxylase [Candidatus Omnitrophica bacterium]|nr:diaminopimelate decarboxylase [Candidatus Omnitrophota bacterium]
MHEFRHKNNVLYCESVRVPDIAERVKTPFYLYSHHTLVDHYRKIKRAFKSVDALICFSMKANSSLAVCRALVNEGAGLDIVSGGELYKALRVGVDPKKIVYAGIGKTRREIEEAMKADILFFNVESLPELILLDSVAGSMRRIVNVSLRLNPDVAVKTHRYIVTGTSESKFGIGFEAARRIFERSDAFPNLRINGLHLHIGSQITHSRPYVRALRRVYAFIKKAPRNLQYLNIGGGLGIVYGNERPQTAHRFAKAVLPIIKKTKLKLILEPGRFVAGNSGILVTKVLYVKESLNKRFVIIDAGMNDMVRPSFYGAYHNIQPVVRKSHGRAPHMVVDVVGPVCESGDFLAKNRRLPMVIEGDILAVMGAGAYGYTMSSNYNSRPRAAEVMVIRDRFYTIREREIYRDLIKGEVIPRELR